jgi:ABC-2 type transport system ATP-binding protein
LFTESEPAVLVDRVTKSYDKISRPAVNDVTVEISRGEIFGILGDNGAGKSTLAKLVTGLLPPDQGSVKAMGMDVAADPLSGTAIAYMPQDSRAMNRLTVSEAVFFAARLRGMSRRGARADVRRLVSCWHLEPFANKVASTLSGGQRRLLQLAVTFAGSLPLVVLDEPTNDLDPVRRKSVWQNLIRLRDETGLTVVFVTHDAVEAEKAVDRVAIMRDGRFIAVGRPDELKAGVALRTNVVIKFHPGATPAYLTERSVDNIVRVSLKHQEAQELLRSLDMKNVEEISLMPATLEELYIHYAS